MKTVILESPFRGGATECVEYAKEAMTHSLNLGEAPIGSHLLYPQVYGNDTDQLTHKLGMYAGFAWHMGAQQQVVYCDLGISPGMVEGVAHFCGVKFAPISVELIRALHAGNYRAEFPFARMRMPWGWSWTPPQPEGMLTIPVTLRWIADE